MIVRQEKKQDFNSIYDLHKKAFKQEDESQLVEFIRSSENFIPGLSLVAEKRGKIIGHILFSKIILRGEKEYESLLLAPMAVLPEYQNQGVGGTLILKGLDRAKELGFSSIFVIGHKHYYPRFGFQRASTWNITCPFEVPDGAFMAIELQIDSLKGKSGVLRLPKAFEG